MSEKANKTNIFSTCDSKSKEELLNELQSLGIDPSTGRKVRSDKGKERGKRKPNSKIRSDYGKYRISTNGVQIEPLTKYARMRTYWLNSEKLSITVDENMIYIPTETRKQVIDGPYSFVMYGRRINRTVRHVAAYSVDLENARFNALQSLCGQTWPERCSTIFKFEKSIFGEDKTPLDIFCTLYHIKEEEYIYWSYEKWRSQYIIVQNGITPLPSTFVFQYGKQVGKDYATEYADNICELELQKREQIVNSKAYEIQRKKITDMITSEIYLRVKREVIANPYYVSFSSAALEKLIKNIIKTDYQKEIDEKIKGELESWIQEQI